VAAFAFAAVPASASGQVFTVIRDTPDLPSYTVPNGPGSIRVPFDLSHAPRTPETRSYEQLLGLWQRAGASYGVPWQVLGAINRIESNFGQNMGPSSAGAVGWMQFMPSTWMRWGMDADGDGLANPWNPDDAVFAAARYLAAAGAHDSIERAIFAYNHAQWYVDDVLEQAELFGDDPMLAGAPGLMFQAADLEERTADARRKVARIADAIHRTDRGVERLTWSHERVERQAGNARLSAAAFRKLDAHLARIEAAQESARLRRERLEDRLAEAVADLDALKEERAGAALAAPDIAGPAPAAVGGYVFPVGGGPGNVSVGHTHHDYPAADIAAPEGSPLYALADSTVVETYSGGNCGIGFKLLLESGVVFVYCHLSYLDPSVTPGTALAAGAPVGLVGSTGHATGPHLHLQFSPAVAYPQDEPWFEAFAGVAFSWQDAPTPTVPKGRLAKAQPAAPQVFRVIRTRVIRFTTFSTG
jgi:murein DD-endopeptidase MepM/ murein hydrolase activator NlpD